MHLLICILSCFLHRVLRQHWHCWKEEEILDGNLHPQGALKVIHFYLVFLNKFP